MGHELVGGGDELGLLVLALFVLVLDYALGILSSRDELMLHASLDALLHLHPMHKVHLQLLGQLVELSVQLLDLSLCLLELQGCRLGPTHYVGCLLNCGSGFPLVGRSSCLRTHDLILMVVVLI